MTQIDRTEGLVGNTAIKAPVRVATTAAIILTGEQTIDGVAVVTGDRVLVKNQANAIYNGIYDVDTGDWTRSQDFDGANDVTGGTLVVVFTGTTNGETCWRISTAGTIEVGTTSIAFEAATFSSSDSLTFIQSGTGAVQRTAQSKMRDWVSVEDFTGATVAAKIQAAHDAVEAAGGGTVIFPSQTYTLLTGLTLNVSKVKFQGTGHTTFDFSGAASNIVGIQVTGNGTGTAFANSPGGIDGINLTGPGDATTAVALRFNAASEAGPSYTAFRNGYISGWLNGVLIVNNSYLLTFDNMNIRVGGSCIVDTPGATNSGERISVINSTLSGAQYGLNAQNGDSDYVLTNTSIDTTLAAIYSRGTEVQMHGGHIECLNKALDSGSSGGTNSRITFSGTRFIQAASSGATPFIHAQADTFLTILGGSINPDAGTTTSISVSANSRLVLLGTNENYSGPVNSFNGCSRVYVPGTSGNFMNAMTTTTGSGTVNCNSAVATTILDVSNPGRYDVYAYVTLGGAATLQGECTVVTNNNTKSAVWKNVGANFDFSLSGNNLQITQTSGGNQDVYWAYHKVL